MKKETLNTIARKTGFSPTTVSRVLNGKHKQYRISENTYQIIMEEIRQSGFSPDYLARALRKGSTRTIGIILPNISNPFFGTIASYTINQLAQSGYSAIIADSEENENSFKTACESLIAMRVEGLLIVPCSDSLDFVKNLVRKIPIVMMDRHFSDHSIPFVSTDNYNGAKMATQKLIDLGHKDITCIQGQTNSSPNKERIRGYQDAMKEAGLEDYLRVVGDSFTLNNGYQQTLQLHQDGKMPSAILALSNTITLGTLKACREKNIRIPQDLSLLSFDDLVYMDYISPSIARIGQSLEEIATNATQMLLNIIKGKKLGTQHIYLPAHYIHGESIQKKL